jgi:murein DD-endopeptidase MepM/ murein hydrolase activator NlpD
MSPTLDPNGKPIVIGPNEVQLVVNKGDKVKAGQLIGFVGDTGNATDKKGIGRPQLHYEVRYGDGLTKAGRVVINPSYFLPIDN